MHLFAPAVARRLEFRPSGGGSTKQAATPLNPAQRGVWPLSTGTLLTLSFSLIVGFVVGGLVHEAGHAITAVTMGGEVHEVSLSGFQVYPTIQIEGWTFSLGHCSCDVKGEWRQNTVAMMGSSTTMAAAYATVGIALLLRRRRRLAVFLGGIAFVWAWDIVLYSALPIVGLRHCFIVGGPEPEPMIAAVSLSMPLAVYFALLLLHCLVFHALLTHLWRRTRVDTNG